MADETVVPATNPTEAAAVPAEESLLSKADQPVVSEGESVLDTAGAEEKAAREAEEKRLIESKVDDLSPDDQAKRASILKAKAESDAKAAEEARAKGVPEKYNVKVPKGEVLDEAALAKVTPVFQKLGITNEQMQGISDYYLSIVKETQAANEALFKNWNDGNAKETMATLGANAKVELGYVAKVKNMLSADTIEALNVSGIGNTKSFILDMAKIGKLFSEEHLVNDKATRRPPTGMTGSFEETAEKIYPTMKQ